MDKLKIIDMATRKTQTLYASGDKLCLGVGYQYGLPGKCIPVTPTSLAALYKIAVPMQGEMMLFGYILPDTIRVLSHIFVLYTFTGAKVVMIYYDTRTGVYGTSYGDGFKEVRIDNMPPCASIPPLPPICTGIGDLVEVEGTLKLFYLTVGEVYSRWAKAAVGVGVPHELLIPVRVVTEIVRDYEAALAKLREQLTAVYADTATVFESIMAQYLRQAQSVARLLQVQSGGGGGGGAGRA